ncbi:MFS transporter [Wukongibacter baidiensis]|uniref:MFS transporter n=1 Tax=Wukongibacter baidiensis TaxID=1723361 RepID=UPI003D7F9274
MFPFLTMFLTSNLGLGEKRAGFYVMLSSFAFAFGSLFGGKIADVVGRKNTFIIFQGVAAICFIPCGFLGNSMIIPWLVILSTFFIGGARPATSAMLIDVTTPENRKEAFSLLYLGMNIGLAVGPLIAGFLLYRNYIKFLFLGDAATTFIALILIGIYIKDTMPSDEEIRESQDSSSEERAEEGNIVSVLLKRPMLLTFAIISIIISFVYSQFTFSIPIQTNELFGEIGKKYFGIIMTTNALTVTLLTVFVTNATKRIKPILNMVISAIFYAIGFGMIFYINNLSLLVVSTVIWTIGEIIGHTNSGVYIANHTPISHRGRFNAILPMISGAGYSIGPMIMGGVIENSGVKVVWPVVFILSIVSATLMYGLYLIEKKKKVREAVLN